MVSLFTTIKNGFLFSIYTVVTSFPIFRVWVKKSCPNTHWWKAVSVHRRKLHQIIQDFRRPAKTHPNSHRYSCHLFFLVNSHMWIFFSDCSVTQAHFVSIKYVLSEAQWAQKRFSMVNNLLQIQHAFIISVLKHSHYRCKCSVTYVVTWCLYGFICSYKRTRIFPSLIQFTF